MRSRTSGRMMFSAVTLLALLGLAQPRDDAAHKKKSVLPTIQTPYRPSVFLNMEFVRKIACFDPKKPEIGVGVGTAEVVGRGIMVTAAHVVDNPDLPLCVDVEAKAIVKPYGVDEEHDFALLSFDDASDPGVEYMKYSCEDFIAEQRYQAIGYALGRSLILNWLTATGTRTPKDFILANHHPAVGMQILRGDIFQGMSGGPILNEQGVMIGINSATDHRGVGLSRSLKDTVLCRQPK